MTVEHEYEQRTPEWWACKLGKITGSHFDEIMKKGRGKGSDWGDSALSYLREIASQILTGQREETFQSKAMEWGNAQEEFALARYIEVTGDDVRPCGFFENTDLPGCGSSPDGIGKDFTLELKCPASKTHMLYLLDGEELFKKYRWQVIGEALFTEKPRAVIASFDPRFKDVSKQMAIYEVPTEQLEADKVILRARLLEAREILEGML